MRQIGLASADPKHGVQRAGSEYCGHDGNDADPAQGTVRRRRVEPRKPKQGAAYCCPNKAVNESNIRIHNILLRIAELREAIASIRPAGSDVPVGSALMLININADKPPPAIRHMVNHSDRDISKYP
jgi:hypothetical protein